MFQKKIARVANDRILADLVFSVLRAHFFAFRVTCVLYSSLLSYEFIAIFVSRRFKAVRLSKIFFVFEYNFVDKSVSFFKYWLQVSACRMLLGI